MEIYYLSFIDIVTCTLAETKTQLLSFVRISSL